ncbi:MAG: hypothetical protein ACYTFD_20500 [Planctomycetota bacterium]
MARTRALLLGALVVAVTFGAIQLLSGEDPEEAAAAQEAADDGVVEVAPVVPTEAIVSASWRTEEERRRAEDAVVEDEDASLLEGVVFGKAGEKRERYEKSVEEMVDDVEGLGVYVAPADHEEDEGKKDGKPRQRKR